MMKTVVKGGERKGNKSRVHKTFKLPVYEQAEVRNRQMQKYYEVYFKELLTFNAKKHGF